VTAGIKIAMDMIMEQAKNSTCLNLKLLKTSELTVVLSAFVFVRFTSANPRRTDARRGRTSPASEPGQRDC
jgi:hypothetical protein